MNKKTRTIDDLLKSTFNDESPEEDIPSALSLPVIPRKKRIRFFMARVRIFKSGFDTYVHIWERVFNILDAASTLESAQLGVKEIHAMTALNLPDCESIVHGYHEWKKSEEMKSMTRLVKRKPKF